MECGAAVKNERRGVSFSSLGYRRGRRDGLFSICCNFLTKHTIVSPRKKGPKEKPGALGWSRRGQARDAGGVRAAGKKARVSGFGRPHEGRVTVARGALSEAEWLRSSVPPSPAGSAEVRRAGSGNKEAAWGGEQVG